MAVELFHDQSLRKSGTRLGSNWQTLDLQSDMLPTVLLDCATGPGVCDCLSLILLVSENQLKSLPISVVC